MASLIQSASRLLFNRKPRVGLTDEERPAPQTQPQGFTNTASSTVGVDSNGGLAIPRSTYIPNDDPLTRYRLLLGISTPPYLGYDEQSHLGPRPAANIGIYSRVVYNEQKNKDSFKVFSFVINGCYFLQIIVAAALTALGAANASNRAVTVFGAINTVIAGFLTFLKGSGLPGRLKYYGHEWRKIREYIDQRERDFSREGSTLNVDEVVATIEQMYKNTKHDIEANQPDKYTSVMGQRQSDADKVGGIDISKLSGIAEKLKHFDEKHISGGDGGGGEGAGGGGILGKVRHFAQDLEKRTHQEVHDHEKAIVKGVHSYEDQVRQEVSQQADRARTEIQERQAEAGKLYDDAARDLGQSTQEARDSARGVGDSARGVQDEVRDTARDVNDGVQDLNTGVRDARARQDEAVDNARSGVQRMMDRLTTDLTGRPQGEHEKR